MENTSSKLDNKIGVKDTSALKHAPAPVVVESVSIVSVSKKPKQGEASGEYVGDKVVFTVRHPEHEKPIDLSSCTYIRDKAIKQSAFWYNEDIDGSISKSSALAICLKHYGAETARGMIGKTLTTEQDSKGYLCVKAY